MRAATDNGFTIVESIVAALVSAILAMVLFTLLKMNNDGVSRGSVNTKIQMQYEAVIQEVGDATRQASAVLDANGGETWTDFMTGADTGVTRTGWIEMYDNTGTKISGYKVTGTAPNTWLQEYDNNVGSGTYHTYIPFKVGKDTVKTFGNFSVSWDRKQDTVLLRVFSSFNKEMDTTDVKMETFICRN